MIRSAMLVLLLTLSACTGKGHRFDLTKPVSLDMNPPEGPENYQQGWSDGCESGVAATNTNLQLFLKTHRYTLDSVRWQKDWLYRKAWQYGYHHCGFSLRSMTRYNL